LISTEKMLRSESSEAPGDWRSKVPMAAGVWRSCMEKTVRQQALDYAQLH
jgi:hypothetical protein